jgi:hypothetical protein
MVHGRPYKGFQTISHILVSIYSSLKLHIPWANMCTHRMGNMVVVVGGGGGSISFYP